MKPRDAKRPSEHPGVRPGRGWRWARRTTQALALVALCVGPLIGGWQRLDYTRERSSWLDVGWSLPTSVQQSLSLGISPDTLYEANQVIGGGIAAELFAIPFMDPLAGSLALLGGGGSSRTVIALLFPIAIAMLAGRVFCGWFCAFGTLSRWIDALVTRLPRYRVLALPKRRWLRWGVLASVVAATLLGEHLLLYLLLPYLLLQQSVYAAWLLGGGSAIAGVLGGLLVAGVVFGPTAYCASICPTGAALSLLGRRRVFRLLQPSPTACGKHCDLCNRACWLQLDPGSGDPGPDCDLCARCVPSCPRANLVVVKSVVHSVVKPDVKSVVKSPRRAARGALTAMAMVAALGVLLSGPAEAREERKPSLILDSVVSRADVTISASAIDYTGFRLDADWVVAKTGVELSIFIARGELQGPAEDGMIANRETYTGRLHVEVVRDGEVAEPIVFLEPNSPISAQRRRIYRAQLPFQLSAGDRVRVAAIPGWFADFVELEIPSRGSRIEAGDFARYFGISALGFSGLLALAFIGRSTDDPQGNPQRTARG